MTLICRKQVSFWKLSVFLTQSYCMAFEDFSIIWTTFMALGQWQHFNLSRQLHKVLCPWHPLQGCAIIGIMSFTWMFAFVLDREHSVHLLQGDGGWVSHRPRALLTHQRRLHFGRLQHAGVQRTWHAGGGWRWEQKETSTERGPRHGWLLWWFLVLLWWGCVSENSRIRKNRSGLVLRYGPLLVNVWFCESW